MDGGPREIALAGKKAMPVEPAGGQMAVGNRKTLIPLHFSNLELHNKLLAPRHLIMG
jgi:hypothetical protein